MCEREREGKKLCVRVERRRVTENERMVNWEKQRKNGCMIEERKERKDLERNGERARDRDRERESR